MLVVPIVLLAVGVGIAYFVDAKRDPKPEASTSGANLLRINGTGDAAGNQSLRFEDLAQIERVIAELNLDSVSITPHLALPHSVSDEQGAGVHVIGIDAGAAALVGLDAMKDNVVYSVGGKTKNVALEVRVITEVDAEGITSGRGEEVHINREPGLDEALLETLTGGAPGETWVVTTPTFWTFAETTFEADEADIIAKANAVDLAGIQLLSEVLISVKNADDFDAVQAAVDDAGYPTEAIAVAIGG